MSTVLITGSSRGIGLGLVKHFLKNESHPPRLVFAACRTPETAKELNEIAKNDSRVVVIQLDVTKYDSFPGVVKKVDEMVGDHGLNVLIHNAGSFPKNMYIKSVDETSPEEFREQFETNAIAPVFLTQALLPLIKRAAAANKDQPMGISRAAVLFMSAYLGSVSLNTGNPGPFWTYRESKAAFNMSAVSFGHQLRPDNIFVCALHPGVVQTNAAGKYATLTVDESVSGMMKVMNSLDESKHNKFFQWDGVELSW